MNRFPVCPRPLVGPSCRSMIRLLFVALLPIGMGACTMVAGGVQPPVGPPMVEAEEPETRPLPTPETAAGAERAVPPIGARVVEVALESIGAPYEWGGTDANGFDCSGLIQFAYGKFGIALPRQSAAQIRAGSSVDPVPALLRPGDVLGFSRNSGGTTSHVGLYVGRGEFIHSGSGGVQISTLRSPYWQGRLVAARRIAE